MGCLSKFWITILLTVSELTLANSSNRVLAQITPDGTLGIEGSIVNNGTINGVSVELIEGGASRGAALFHSFFEFNVGEGNRVYFGNPVGIENIFSRVTGNTPSDILGTLGVNGGANLFLLNPNGIIFGPNARLDIRGSFVASTADELVFDNGVVFSASNPEVVPLLTLNITPGLQYGGNNIPQSAIQGGQIITANTTRLEVGQDLTLVASNLDLQGELYAGRNLTLFAQNTVRVRDSVINPFIAQAGERLLIQGNQSVDIFALNHPNSGLFSGGDMVLRSANTVVGDAHYWSGGSFLIEELDGSLGDLDSPNDPIVLANGDVSLGKYTGASLHVLAGGSVTIGDISINATDTADKTISPDNTNPFIASLANANLSNGTTSVIIDGSARPTLDIRAGIDWNLLGGLPGNTDPGNLAPNFKPNATSADINIGDISIKAPDGLVFLTNQYQPNQSLPSRGIEVNEIRTDDNFGNFFGNSGSVIIDYRGGITVSDRIVTSSASGDGGDITLITDQLISLDNSSLLSRTLGTGQGGNIDVKTGSLFVTNGGQLNASTAGKGNAGNVTIEALDLVSFDGIGSSKFGSGAFSRVEEGAEGNGGNITITTGSLSVTNGGRLTSSTNGQGNAGNVKIAAQNRVSFDGQGSDGTPSGAYSLVNSLAQGNSGNIEIVAESVFLTNGSVLNTATLGQGNAGNMTIKARDRVSIEGQGNAPSNISSGIFVGAEGNGGNIEILAGSVILTDRTWMDSRVAGKGNAGNVTIETRDGVILNNVGGENLTVMSGGAIISNGILNINSDTKLTNTSGDIILNDVTSKNLTVNSNGAILGNGILTINNNANFISNLANAGNVSVTNTKATTIGNSIIGGNFTLNSNGLVSQVPGEFLQVAGIILVNGSGSSPLVNTSSLPPALTILANGDTIINQVGTVNLPANNLSGNLTVNSLPKAVVSFNSISNTPAITLNQPNLFGGTLRFNTTSDAIFVTGTPGITQSGSQIVGGTATFNADIGNISLNDFNNQFGKLAFTGNDVSIREADGTNLQTSTAIGNFNLTSGGPITQTGVLNIGGDTSLIATLPNAGNVTITNRNATILGNSLIGGNFTIDSGGAISQVPGELLQVAGNTAIANPSSQPALDINGNILPRLTLPNGDTIISGVGIVNLNPETFSGNLTVNSLANAVQFTGIYDNPSIILNQPGNSFSGTLRIKTDAPTTVALTGTPAITQSGSLEVKGTATFNAQNGNITLNDSGNQFGNLAFTGNIISIIESNATNLQTSTITGNLNLISGGAITQQGSLNVIGNSSFTSLLPNAPIILTDSNQMLGPIGFTTTGNGSVTLFNTLATTQLATSNILGDFTINSGGIINQTGALKITGLTTLNAGNSDIILNQDNDFNTVILSGGRNVLINEIDRINLGNSSVSGSLNVNANGNITTGDIFSPSSSITLISTNGDIDTTAGKLNTFSFGAGGAITLFANGNITTGSISSRGSSIAGGDITLTSNGKISSAHSFITSRTIGSGKAGNINIQAQSVSFTDRTIVSASTFGIGNGGNINITAPSISFTDGAQLRTTTSSNGKGGNITVTASELVELVGIRENLRSGFFADTLGTGTAGNIIVTTGRLLVQNGATITASTFGGEGGNVTVNSSNTELIGVGTITSGQILPSALATVTFTAGKAGNLTVNTNNFIAQNGGLASASTFDSGKGGSLTVNASESVQLRGISADGSIPSALSTDTFGSGNAGELIVNTRLLTLQDGAAVSASTLGNGEGGRLTVNASEGVELKGAAPNGFASGLYVQSLGDGDSRDLKIVTNELRIQDGAKVTVASGSAADARVPTGQLPFLSLPPFSNNPTGNAGNIDIQARSISVTNGAEISAATSGGKGGTIQVIANTLAASNSGQLSTTTAGNNDAGDIILEVKDNINLNGKGSGLFANTLRGSTGNGGSIFIDSINLNIQNGATVAVDSKGSGEGGNIEIKSDSVFLNDAATITAETTSNEGGNIILNIDNWLFMRHGSKISTTAGTDRAGGNGGNITINAPFIVGIREEDSDITANAFEGNGGRINLTAQSIVGLEFRRSLTPLSDITASSELGLDGVVDINLPDVDPSRGLNPLPDVPDKPEFSQNCQANPGSTGRFINAGRGGLPTNPYEPITTNDIWEDIQPPTQETATTPDSSTISNNHENGDKRNGIVEAQGWIINEKGEVTLVAQMPSETSKKGCSLR